MTTSHQIRAARIEREAEGYLELGMAPQAVETLGRLGAPEEYSAKALHLLGEALRSQEQYLEAIPPLVRAAKATPEDVHIRLALGWCYKRTGQLDLAIEALEQTLLVEPNNALLRYNLACYLSLDGQKRRALRYLSQALSLDSKYRELIDAETDFDPIRNDSEFQSLCSTVSG